MSQPNPPADDVIRISRQEALAPHVDDMLKRQKSLRGESGVTRGRQAWYYQNWFVFMLVGGLAALVAWALIEPYFNDMLHVQGRVDSVSAEGAGRRRIELGAWYLDLHIPVQGSIEVDGVRVWVLQGAKIIGSGDPVLIENIDDLKVGQNVGLYVERNETPGGEVALAAFVTLDPPAVAESPSLTQQGAQQAAASLLLFPLVAGLVGLGIGAVDGIICRTFRRALLAGLIGLMVGFIGGFVSEIIAGLIYTPLNALAMGQQGESLGDLSGFGFFVQMVGRGLAWTAAGMAMGLGQGITLRSGRLLLYGFLGGLIGGLLGGLLFDPIDFLILGTNKPGAHVSRLVGLVTIGAVVGLMIGVVELLARDAWLRMTKGPLAGKEFLIFKDLMQLGSSPRADIYLFNDPLVAPHHVNLRMVGDDCDMETAGDAEPVEVNDRICRRARLRHGDTITIGRTSFVYEKRGN